MELFEFIRREYEFGEGTISGVARKLGVHRRMVREAIGNAIPSARKRPHRDHWKLKAFIPQIEAMLEEDRDAPRKQRHTAHRIWRRLKDHNPGLSISERTVRKYVRKRRLILGLIGRETCIPQSYPWGSEAQVDWYEAYADLGGERTCLQVFAMRSMASGASFHHAYLRATQQAFLEGHELAFQRFGGVFRRLRYDNLAAAVKRILRGHRREETARFIAFRSHWRFEAVFCNPGVNHAHEKGGIEGEGGYYRRNHWVPVPQARDLDDLNAQLPAACYQDEQRKIAGREMTVGQAVLAEKQHLLPLAAEGFDLAEVSFPIVDGMGRAKVRMNFYSVPVRVGVQVQAKIRPSHIELWHEGQCVARHERSYSRLQEILDLEHYLEPLEHKPGALAGSKPLEQWRQKGRWPASYDRIWEQLMMRNGRQNGTRSMIDLLRLGKVHGYEKLRQAVELALDMGSCDVSTIRYLITAEQLDRSRSEPIDVGPLNYYQRPLPVMSDYDQLLAAVEVMP
ncbi:MAG: IS21 family transposase [Chloroflexi bacterium]|nr:IS21 family transposase [Chloroflexota bacterium]